MVIQGLVRALAADVFHRGARSFCSGLFAILFVLLAPALDAAGADTYWTSHIEPLLKEHCGECHNPTKAKSGLDLSSLQTILRGGERGSAVIPGHPDESNLYKFLSSESDPHMPPGKRKSLGEEEIGLIKKWIQQLPVAASSRIAEASTNGPATNYSAISAKSRKWSDVTE